MKCRYTFSINNANTGASIQLNINVFKLFLKVLKVLKLDKQVMTGETIP